MKKKPCYMDVLTALLLRYLFVHSVFITTTSTAVWGEVLYLCVVSLGAPHAVRLM